MMLKLLALNAFCLVLSFHSTQTVNNRKFPADFKFGASNAAAQIEGGAFVDGKSESIWDYYSRVHPEKFQDHSTPTVAADSYHKYKEDVSLVKSVGLQLYRFSIAWSRILPKGHKYVINEAGVQYYKNLIKELKKNGIEPMVTLYHWDLPQILEDALGGWRNEKIVDLFADYAELCFKLFGDDIKWWVTINEPRQVCQSGYGGVWNAPGVLSSGIADYICSKNILLSHAKAYHIYDKQFRPKQKGKVAIVIDSSWLEPATNSEKDKTAAETAMQFAFGIYGNPIFKGDWPEVMKDRIAMRSKLEGFGISRLPAFTPEQIKYINGTFDYLAINHYTTNMINATKEFPIGEPSYEKDIGVIAWMKAEWPRSNGWLSVVPWGMRKILVWLKKTYGDVDIIITENGLPDANGTLVDDHRIFYYREYLSNCLDAIYEDKVNLKGYMVWSIIDDWEWSGGYKWPMGMFRVNFTDPNRTRTPRKSSVYMTQVTHNRCLVENCIE